MRGQIELPAAVPGQVRLVRTRLPGTLPAAQAALLVAGDEQPFALVGAWAGGGAIAGSQPLCTLGPGDDPFATLDALPRLEAPAPQGAVGGGWFGSLGYGLGARIERLAPPPPAPQLLPDAVLAFHDHVLRCDGAGDWWFEALWSAQRAAALERRRELLARRLAQAAPAPGFTLGPLRVRRPGIDGHGAAIEACRERIAAGELFQANLALRLDASFDGSPAALATRLFEQLDPAHGAFLSGEWGALASASPELFLRRIGRAVHSDPIKGTAPAGSAAALVASSKDRAENVMIVDLVRNDLGRVCDYGSVVVEELAAPRPGAGVEHLVSRVRGTLHGTLGDAELLRATFPPGSVTGAPKVRAQRVIGELEATAREAYTGAIGYASPAAGLELSVAIRTFELHGARACLQAGGGITWPSNAGEEIEECLAKARPLARAAGTSIARPRATAHRRAEPIPAALGLDAARPDLGAGVFETLLVDAGVAIDLGGHLDRLARSVQEVYGLELARDELRERVLRVAESTGRGRLNVSVRALGGELAVEVTSEPRLPGSKPGGQRLKPFLLPGGLGPHKWADRALLSALTTRAGGDVPLLVDGDGCVLEAAWANVWTLDGEQLRTPPADGRLLPGVTRAALLERAAELGLHACEAQLTLEDLRRAPALLLTSSLRGAVPARLNAEAPPEHEATIAQLATLLTAAREPTPRPLALGPR